MISVPSSSLAENGAFTACTRCKEWESPKDKNVFKIIMAPTGIAVNEQRVKTLTREASRLFNLGEAKRKTLTQDKKKDKCALWMLICALIKKEDIIIGIRKVFNICSVWTLFIVF